MAKGDIGSQLDTLAWASASGSNPSLEIATGIFVSGNGSSIYSYSVAANGILAAIDTLVLPADATISHIAHISGDVYAAACRYSTTAGTIYTFTVDSSGNIGAATIDSADFSAVLTYSPHICYVAGIVYAISYVYIGYSATVLTMNINNDGTIDASPIIDSWSWGANLQPAIQRLFKVSGTTYAQAYTNKPAISDPTSYIRTFTIADNGTITKSNIATYNVSGGNDSNGPYDMWYCAGSIYAYIFTYISGSYYPFIGTFSIPADGSITPKSSIQVEASATYNDAYSMTAGADGATLIAACNNSLAATCKLFSFTVNTTTGVIAAVDSLLLTGNLGGAQVIRPRTNLLVVVGYKAAAGSIASVDYVETEVVDSYVYPSSISSSEAFGSTTIFPNISTIASSVVNDYSAVGRCIVLSVSAPSGNRIFVFYRDPSNGGKYSYTDNNGGSWTTGSFLTGSIITQIDSVRADMGPIVGLGPEIIHILYDDVVGDGTYYNLCYRTLNPVTLVLGTEEVVDSAEISKGETATVGDLYVDVSDIPHIVYNFNDWTSGSYTVIYMDRSGPGGTWVGGVDLETASGYVDSRLGPYGWAGTDVVIGMISNSGTSTYLKAKEYVGGIWGSTITVDSIAPPDGFTGLHVLSVLREISYTSLATMRLATESGGSWSHATLDAAGTQYSGVATAYFSDGENRRSHYWYDYNAGSLYEYRTSKETIGTHYESCGVCDCANITPSKAFFAYCDESGGTYVLKFGINQWVSEQTIYPGSITSGEVFGSPLAGLRVDPTSISSAELFGTDRIDQQLLATGIASLEAFPSPLAGLKVEPTPIGSLESFGSGRIDQQLFASSIASGEAFGSEIVHRQITSIDIPTGGGTDSPINWDTPTPTPGLPPTGWNDGGTTRSQSSTHRYSPTHKYKAHFLMEVVLGKAGGNMSSMGSMAVITIGGEEYKAPTFRMEVHTESS